MFKGDFEKNRKSNERIGDKMKSEKEVLENEILNAMDKVNEAFSEKGITVKEVYLALPVLIAIIFEDRGITRDFEEQKKFYKNLKNVVNSLIGDEDGIQ